MRRLPLLSLFVLSCASTQDAVKPEPKVAEALVDAGVPPAPEPKKPMVPPTRTQVIKETIHGLSLADPFRWLEDEKSPEVQTWMKAQDDFARKNLHALPGREWLTKRYTELYYLDAISIPVKRAGRYFYTRQRKDKEKAVVYWKDEKGEEHVLLDPNT
jgi:prolyl oligopeptidase